MFSEGFIIRFDPFYFKNGNTPKPKFGLILKRVDGDTILLSLPTKHDHIPSSFDLSNDMECIELPAANQNCFFLSTTKVITECGKKFPLNTFLYGHQLDVYVDLEGTYPQENVHYSVWGKVKDEIFSEIVRCFKESKSVKRKFKKML